MSTIINCVIRKRKLCWRYIVPCFIILIYFFVKKKGLNRKRNPRRLPIIRHRRGNTGTESFTFHKIPYSLARTPPPVTSRARPRRRKWRIRAGRRRGRGRDAATSQQPPPSTATSSPSSSPPSRQPLGRTNAHTPPPPPPHASCATFSPGRPRLRRSPLSRHPSSRSYPSSSPPGTKPTPPRFSSRSNALVVSTVPLNCPRFATQLAFRGRAELRGDGRGGAAVHGSGRDAGIRRRGRQWLSAGVGEWQPASCRGCLQCRDGSLGVSSWQGTSLGLPSSAEPIVSIQAVAVG